MRTGDGGGGYKAALPLMYFELEQPHGKLACQACVPEEQLGIRETVRALSLYHLQCNGIQWVLGLKSIPYYKKKFKELRVKPEDIKTLADIKKLPFTTKDDLRKNAPFGMMATSLDNCVELHASSGTTGIPVTTCYTRGDLDVWSEVMARCLSMARLTKKDMLQNRIPYGTFTGAFGFHYGAQKIGALVIPSGKGQSERQIKLMEYYGTTFLSGVASYAIRLGQVSMDMGIDPKHLKVRNGLFGAEMFTHGLKKRIMETCYRVLLTRGRDGTVVYVPDDRRMDQTFARLRAVGLRELQ